jgi:drug/metabolite transporter (DMT)-like permease
MRFTAWLVLIGTLLLWSGNWIVARAVRDDIAPGFATVGRLLVVLAVLLPFTAKGLFRSLPSFRKRDWVILSALGFTGGGLNPALQWLGLHYTTATNGILFLSVTPVFILLLAAPLGERIRILQWGGVLVSFCGVVTIAARGDPGVVTSLAFNIGDLLALLSMVSFAAYTVLLRVRKDPLEIAELLTVVCAMGLFSLLPWLAWEIAFDGKIQLNPAGVGAILYSAFGSQLLAYLGWSYVVMRLGAGAAGVTLHLMPAMGVALSALFLGEFPLWFHFAGIALILAGVALSSGRVKMRRTSIQELR